MGYTKWLITALFATQAITAHAIGGERAGLRDAPAVSGKLAHPGRPAIKNAAPTAPLDRVAMAVDAGSENDQSSCRAFQALGGASDICADRQSARKWTACASRPASVSQAATNSAIAASPRPPGTSVGFTESISTRRATRSVTSAPAGTSVSLAHVRPAGRSRGATDRTEEWSASMRRRRPPALPELWVEQIRSGSRVSRLELAAPLAEQRLAEQDDSDPQGDLDQQHRSCTAR